MTLSQLTYAHSQNTKNARNANRSPASYEALGDNIYHAILLANKFRLCLTYLLCIETPTRYSIWPCRACPLVSLPSIAPLYILSNPLFICLFWCIVADSQAQTVREIAMDLNLADIQRIAAVRYPFDRANYPALPENKDRARDFARKHVFLHLTKNVGAVARSIESCDHGGKVESISVETIRKLLVNAIQMADVSGISMEDVHASIQKWADGGE